ncbi:MAG: hypothetical protein AW10_00811 [Candidatus Accumulibacter appositus]|mgnify:CR=1 FL=1|uniref:Uncharacterized protein n=1 Tax=Candidatus Accumulibacter appositus TaxID=1454003 RepID=A0A011PZ18_9PROT|nr:hypothetical protein [Accumulibacter sp.]EXI82125.1 MAG: hypothetical protein AW10_00811 [Candidatus Accumulibacter appositus]HRF03418.1 hypothetical protein [Accumulibacter sp.]
MLIAEIPQALANEISATNTTVEQQRSNAATSPELLYGTIGVCVLSPTLGRMQHGGNSPFSNGRDIYPKDSAGQIFPDARFDGNLQADIEAARVQILKQPKHGQILIRDGFRFQYLPQDGYTGNDEATLLVNIGGKNVRVVYFITVLDISTATRDDDQNYNYREAYTKHCEKSEWRIFYNPPTTGSVANNATHHGLNSPRITPVLTLGEMFSAVIGQTTDHKKMQPSPSPLPPPATATSDLSNRSSLGSKASWVQIFPRALDRISKSQCMTSSAQVIRPAANRRLLAAGMLQDEPTGSMLLLPDDKSVMPDTRTGDIKMPMIDMTTPPTQTAPITVCAIQGTSPRQVYGGIEVCYLSPTAEQIKKTTGLPHPSLSPRDMANNIFWDGSHSQIFHLDYENASIAVLQPPEHGKISEDLSAERDIRYYPDEGYSGDDKIVFLANIEGYEILVMYSIRVNTRYYSDANANPYSTHCPSPNWWQVLRPGSGEALPSQSFP